MPGSSLPTPMRQTTQRAEQPTAGHQGACTCNRCTCSPCTCGQAAPTAAESGIGGHGSKPMAYRTTGGAGVLGSYAPPPAAAAAMSNITNTGTGTGIEGNPEDAYQQMTQEVGGAAVAGSSSSGTRDRSSSGSGSHGSSSGSSGREPGAGRYESDYDYDGAGAEGGYDGGSAFPTATELVGAMHTTLQAPPGAEGLQSRAPGGAGVTGSYGPPSSAFPPQVPAGAAGGLAEEVDAAAEGIRISKL
ncbi:hypothetical protein HYH02_012947 [Chlamydomonas schloesseri]|uniref:Uncharacterized protein n=1 Tax=Chlamydomonas schloesseri TaxID=2026947 RepID=A0A835W0D9_9CHLO|nr:hypothetical protein HYH02_012947 [Chlamydomonas schloesseri]|eukprot:KAG2432374.1 hypothetical protein HYH02_012947 [Chlamydomonas schloesseri]